MTFYKINFIENTNIQITAKFIFFGFHIEQSQILLRDTGGPRYSRIHYLRIRLFAII